MKQRGRDFFLATKQRGHDFFIHSKQRGHDFFGACKNPTARPRIPINFDRPLMLPDIPEEIHPVKLDVIDAELVRKAAIKTRGGSGPSGLAADDGWRRIILSRNFGDSSSDLCQGLAEVIKKMCTVKDISVTLEAFLACRLIPLDKNPSLRPIGVGEVLRRIVGKVVVSVVRNDIISSVGSLQVCVGHEGGCEAAIHAMHSIFEEEDTEAVMLIDAGNAFNSINREAFLHNIFIICPVIATFVRNCYGLPYHAYLLLEVQKFYHRREQPKVTQLLWQYMQ